MVDINAELKRRDSLNALVAWKLVADAINTATGLSDPVIDYGTRAKLDEVKTKLDTLIANTDQLEAFVDGMEALLTSLLANTDDTLVGRMFAKEPFDSTYRIWVDTADANFIYIAENTLGAAESEATFRGIRVPKNAAGNPVGKTEVNLTFKWSDKTGGSWS